MSEIYLLLFNFCVKELFFFQVIFIKILLQKKKINLEIFSLHRKCLLILFSAFLVNDYF